MTMAEAAASLPGSQWSSRSIADPDLMVALQDSLPVALIATPRREFCVCRSDETVAEAIRLNKEGFDHLPVVDASRDGRKRIVGLVELARLTDGRPADSPVRNHMAPLTEDNLIGADASILAFVRSADTSPCRLVLSGSEVTGLVSLSESSATTGSRRPFRVGYAVRNDNGCRHTQRMAMLHLTYPPTRGSFGAIRSDGHAFRPFRLALP